MDDPARPSGDVPTDWGPLDLIVASRSVWAAIARFVRGVVDRVLQERILNSGNLANIACTMGTPGQAIVASAIEPWGFIVVPFYGIIQTVKYYIYPAGGTFTVDVKIIRPGQTLAGASTFYPGAPPSFTEDVSLSTSGDWMGYVEPGAVLVFYVTAASGVNLVSANVIMRTLEG